MMLELLGDVLILAFGLFSLWLFLPIFRYGEVTLIEGNRALLIAEIIMAALVVLIALERAINDIRRLGR